MGIRAALLTAAAFLSAPGARAEDCDCSRYASHVTLVSLARQAAVIGIRSTDTAGAAFHRSDEEVRLHERLLARARESIPARCHGELLSDFNDRVRIVARYSSESSPVPNVSSGARSESHLGAYTSLLSGLTDLSGCSEPSTLGDSPTAAEQEAFASATTAYQGCVRQARGAGYDRLTRAMGSTAALRRASSGVTGNPMGAMSASDLTVIRTFHAIVNAGDDLAARDRILATREVQELPFMDKVALAAVWLRRGNQHYDNLRRDGVAPNNQGAVSWSMINGNLREQTRLGLFGGGAETLSAEYLASGVCRDMHIGAVEMLRLSGVRQSYGKAYDMADGGGHLTTHTQDPGNPLTNVDINYGDVAPRAGGDQRALYTNDWAGDTTFDYRMYHPRAAAGRLTSELGRYVMEAAGMDIRSDISGDPLAEARSTIVGGRFGIVSDPNFTLDATFAHGRDGIGSRHTGGGVAAGWAQQTLFPGRATFYAGMMQREPGYGPIADQRLTLDILHASIEQEARTPDYRLVEGVTVRGEAGAGVEMANTHVREGVAEEDIGEWGTTFDIRFYTGMRVDQGDPLRDRFSSTHRAGVQTFIDKDDPRSRRSFENTALAINHGVLSSRFNYRLDPETEARLVLDTTLMLNQFGSYGRADLGFVTDRFSASAFIQGRLADDDATFVDGARREVGLSLRAMPTDWLDLSLTATTPIEETPAEVSDTGAGSSVGPQVTGTAALRF